VSSANSATESLSNWEGGGKKAPAKWPVLSSSGAMIARSANVEDLLECIHVRVDVHIAVDFQRRICADVVERVRFQMICDDHLVVDVKLIEETSDEAGFLLLTAGEKPYGHCSPSSAHPVVMLYGSDFGECSKGMPV
jgi:hypothetical protein